VNAIEVINTAYREIGYQRETMYLPQCVLLSVAFHAESEISAK